MTELSSAAGNSFAWVTNGDAFAIDALSAFNTKYSCTFANAVTTLAFFTICTGDSIAWVSLLNTLSVDTIVTSLASDHSTFIDAFSIMAHPAFLTADSCTRIFRWVLDYRNTLTIDTLIARSASDQGTLVSDTLALLTYPTILATNSSTRVFRLRSTFNQRRTLVVVIKRSLNLTVSLIITEFIIEQAVTSTAAIPNFHSSNATVWLKNLCASGFCWAWLCRSRLRRFCRKSYFRTCEVFIEVLGYFAEAIIVAILVRVLAFTVS